MLDQARPDEEDECKEGKQDAQLQNDTVETGLVEENVNSTAVGDDPFQETSGASAYVPNDTAHAEEEDVAPVDHKIQAHDEMQAEAARPTPSPRPFSAADAPGETGSNEFPAAHAGFSSLMSKAFARHHVSLSESQSGPLATGHDGELR